MTPAGAERLARRLHRYELDDTGAPYVDRLARVAALAAEAGGGPRELMAAWLHGASRAGLRPRDLAARGVPAAVIRIVGVVSRSPQPGEESRYVASLRSCPGAATVLLAIVTDRYRPGAHVRSYEVSRDAALLARAGLPLPAALSFYSERERGSRLPADRLLEQLNPGNRAPWPAVQALIDSGDPAAIGPLTELYLTAGGGRRAIARQAARAALSGIVSGPRRAADPRWAEAVLALAAHDDAVLRAMGIRGLAGLPRYRARVLRALSDDVPGVVEAALSALEPVPPHEAAGLLAGIAARDAPEWDSARRHAARMLARAGDPRARDLLLGALTTGDLNIARALAAILRRDGAAPFLPRLLSQLRDTRPDRSGARTGAAIVLGEIRAREAVAGLAAAAAGNPQHASLVLQSVTALGKIADPAAVPALAQACRHAYSRVRVCALDALAGIDDPRVTEIALAAADDFDPDVRDRAIRLLAARGDKRATSLLLTCCHGPLAPVALRGLIRLADERAVPGLVRLVHTASDRRVLHLAGRAIVRSARRDPPPHPLYPGRWMTVPRLLTVIWVTGELRVPRASLASLLKHGNEFVRARTAAALGKIADPASAGDLTSALADVSPRVRASAATALGGIGGGSARRPLESLLEDPHRMVRMAAAAALRRIP